jgi:hypothetical protein
MDTEDAVIYTKEYEIMSFAGKWMELEIIMLIEKANLRNKYHMF